MVVDPVSVDQEMVILVPGSKNSGWKDYSLRMA
jgi:hypothetical protein